MNSIKRLIAFIVMVLMITEMLPFNAFSNSIWKSRMNVHADELCRASHNSSYVECYVM